MSVTKIIAYCNRSNHIISSTFLLQGFSYDAEKKNKIKRIRFHDWWLQREEYVAVDRDSEPEANIRRHPFAEIRPPGAIGCPWTWERLRQLRCLPSVDSKNLRRMVWSVPMNFSHNYPSVFSSCKCLRISYFFIKKLSSQKYVNNNGVITLACFSCRSTWVRV